MSFKHRTIYFTLCILSVIFFLKNTSFTLFFFFTEYRYIELFLNSEPDVRSTSGSGGSYGSFGNSYGGRNMGARNLRDDDMELRYGGGNSRFSGGYASRSSLGFGASQSGYDQDGGSLFGNGFRNSGSRKFSYLLSFCRETFLSECFVHFFFSKHTKAGIIIFTKQYVNYNLCLES